MARRIIICCPTSLVSNWDSECIKWLKVQPATVWRSAQEKDTLLFLSLSTQAWHPERHLESAGAGEDASAV